MKGINLLKRAQTPQILAGRVKKIFNIISAISIIVFVLVFVSLLLGNIFLSTRIGTTNTRIKNAEIKLNSLAEIELTQITINDKIISLEKIFATTKNYNLDIKGFESILPVDTSITQLTLDEEGFSITLTSPRLASFNEFIVKLISSDQEKGKFKKIFLDDLSVGEDGVYRMGVSGERVQ